MMENRLQYISQGQTAAEQELNIRRALDNGATWIQLRWKHVEPGAFHALAEAVGKQTEAYRATFIVNDQITVAQAVDADGVHLGLTDSSIAEARACLGSNKIIGGTANTLKDVRQRIQEGCDYIGLGPFRFTSTKEQLSPVLGREGYEAIMRELNGDDCPPIYAIGGIQIGDILLLRSMGVYGGAISGLITANPVCIPQINELLENKFSAIGYRQ